MSATEEYVNSLMQLKPGELGLLRTHAGRGLDESVEGFDLFAGLWWPLRQKSSRAPRREVAWLIAKLYAFCPIPQSSGNTLAYQLSLCQPHDRIQAKFDELLLLPIDSIEFSLQWALEQIAANSNKLDWVKLTDDLSYWEHENKRLEWAEQFLNK